MVVGMLFLSGRSLNLFLLLLFFLFRPATFNPFPDKSVIVCVFDQLFLNVSQTFKIQRAVKFPAVGEGPVSYTHLTLPTMAVV